MRISDWSSDVCSSDLIDSAIRDCLQRRLPVILAPKRGRKAGKGAEAGNGIVGQEKISGTDSARDDKPFGFGGPDQVKALPRRHVAEVDGCLCLARSEEHTSELQSLMRLSYAVFCLKK